MKPPAATGDVETAMQWWERRRPIYNVALIIAIILGYFAYQSVVTYFADVIGRPILDENGNVIGHRVDSGGIAVISELCGACMALLLANVFFLLGAAVEHLVPVDGIGTYRKWAWPAGLAFSCSLPFTIALLHLFLCAFFPNFYASTPIQF